MIPAGTKVYFAVAPADLRKSFDGLSALAMGELELNPAAGGMFVFLNKRGNQVRVLFRDKHGCCVLAKRLDRGCFKRPRVEEGRICWEVDALQLMNFLDEVDFSRGRRADRSAGAPSHLKVVT